MHILGSACPISYNADDCLCSLGGIVGASRPPPPLLNTSGTGRYFGNPPMPISPPPSSVHYSASSLRSRGCGFPGPSGPSCSAGPSAPQGVSCITSAPRPPHSRQAPSPTPFAPYSKTDRPLKKGDAGLPPIWLKATCNSFNNMINNLQASLEDKTRDVVL